MSKNPIRVAEVMGKMLGGGVEAVVMNYYRRVDRSRVQFDFLVDSDSTLVPREEIESLGGRVFFVPPYQQIRAYMSALEELFLEQRWTIVHSHLNTLSIFPLKAAKKAGIPIRIAHSHSTAGKGEYKKNLLKYILRTQANRYPTHRMACSQYAGEWLFGKDAKFDVIFNAIELNRFAFNADARAQVRSELGLVDADFVIGHVGRYVTTKNHFFLLKVFEQVVAERPAAKLLLVGAGELRPSIESWVAEHKLCDKVFFLGQRDDVERLYQAFDVFALPSLYEGLGLVGVEAQRAGLPCLLSDAITREVDVTGTCEFLPIDDSEIWTDALCALETKSDAERADTSCTAFSDYDIVRQGAWLTDKYLELYEEAFR